MQWLDQPVIQPRGKGRGGPLNSPIRELLEMYCIWEAAKKLFFSGPATKAFKLSDHRKIFLKLQKKYFFFSGQALTPPPLIELTSEVK